MHEYLRTAGFEGAAHIRRFMIWPGKRIGLLNTRQTSFSEGQNASFSYVNNTKTNTKPARSDENDAASMFLDGWLIYKFFQTI